MNKLTITAALARIKQITGIDVTLTAHVHGRNARVPDHVVRVARAPLDARVAYVLDGRHHEWRWFIPEYEACVAYLQTNPKKAYAQYDAYTISVCRQIVKETT